jgi:hypothetical protein
MLTHKEDSDAAAERGNLFGKELGYGILAIVVLGILYIMTRNYLNRRARDAAQHARDAPKQAHCEAQRKRVTVSTYDTQKYVNCNTKSLVHYN